ncbi:hypothetical protein E2C01_097121 [Portunus trituberculatus]|uniref:Uncharacterized protein n=1 Tax=Portunus trituberculatus TaxID=210409 RepID=A0A5B7K4W7_PORTR|nr:hypothetical protein [Portunus trituberculatus]
MNTLEFITVWGPRRLQSSSRRCGKLGIMDNIKGICGASQPASTGAWRSVFMPLPLECQHPSTSVC